GRAKAGSEMAVAREAERDADGREVAPRIEHLVERHRHACAQLVAVQRRAGELAESPREMPRRAVHALRERREAPGLAGVRRQSETDRLDDFGAARAEPPLP